jgi:acetyltransferase
MARSSGYSYIITVGNEAVTELADYVDALADDPHTRVIACFVEGFRSPARFFAAARRAILAGKRLVVLKTGRSELAQRAALAHTGSLTGPDDAYDAWFRRLGIVRVYDLDELIEAAELLSAAGTLPSASPAIVSISGGSGGIVADLAQSLGLALQPFAQATSERLRAILPPFASVNTPRDLTGAISDDPTLLPRALAALADDPGVGPIALALNTPIGADEPNRALYQAMCRAMAERSAASDKPHIIFSMSSGHYDPEIVEIARAAGVPLLMGMREALAAIARAQRSQTAIMRLRAVEDLAAPDLTEAAVLLRQSSATTLGEHQAKALLAAAGITVTREHLAATPAAAVRAAERIGYPVALKISSPDIPHKTEAGGVRTDLTSPDQVAAAFSQILDSARRYAPGAQIDGVLVQEMLRGGVEMLVGVTNHAGLGPTIVFGLGGIFVEAFQDWAMRAAPLAPGEAAELIGETRAACLLNGWRGGPPLDSMALEQTLLRVSQLAWQLRDKVSAIDITPLLVLPHGQGVVALDALIVLRE